MKLAQDDDTNEEETTQVPQNSITTDEGSDDDFSTSHTRVKQHSDALKQSAIELVNNGNTYKAVAHQLCVDARTVARWHKESMKSESAELNNALPPTDDESKIEEVIDAPTDDGECTLDDVMSRRSRR